MKTKPSLLPQKIDENSWYHECKDSIVVSHNIFDKNGKYLYIAEVLIPKIMLIESLRRMR